MLKLGYLFTFITALLKVTGVINVSWLIVILPTIVPLIIVAFITITMFLIAIVMELISK